MAPGPGGWSHASSREASVRGQPGNSIQLGPVGRNNPEPELQMVGTWMVVLRNIC